MIYCEKCVYFLEKRDKTHGFNMCYEETNVIKFICLKKKFEDIYIKPNLGGTVTNGLELLPKECDIFTGGSFNLVEEHNSHYLVFNRKGKSEEVKALLFEYLRNEREIEIKFNL